MYRILLPVVAVISLTMAVGCHRQAATEAPAKPPILVFAAASTNNAIEEIRAQFTRNSGVAVETSYASSAVLAKQIEHGAEADVFLSADVKWADYLEGKGLVAQRQNLLSNRLVIVVPADSPLKLNRPEDLATAPIEHLALGDPQSVPAGRYAKQALLKLGIWDRLQAKVVSAADVRQALAYVETGAAQAAIVYATDAAISKKAKMAAAIPAELTEPIRYPAVLLKHGQGNTAAEAFYRHLASPEAGKVFEKYGFGRNP